MATKGQAYEAKTLKLSILLHSYISIQSKLAKRIFSELRLFENDLVRFSCGQALKLIFSLSFAGIYAHCGNSYGATNVTEVERVRDSSRDMMLALKTRYGQTT